MSGSGRGGCPQHSWRGARSRGTAVGVSRELTFGGDYLRDAVGHGFQRDALDVGERIGELLRGRAEHRALRHRRRGDPADVLHARLERALKIGVVESVFVDEFGGRTDGPLGSTPRRGLRGHRASVRGHHTRTPRSSFCPLPFFFRPVRGNEKGRADRTRKGRGASPRAHNHRRWRAARMSSWPRSSASR